MHESRPFLRESILNYHVYCTNVYAVEFPSSETIEISNADIWDVVVRKLLLTDKAVDFVH